MLLKELLVVFCLCTAGLTLPTNEEHLKMWGEERNTKGRDYHPIFRSSGISPTTNQDEATAKFWNDKAKKSLNERLKIKENHNIAKNVILFLGDGMSVPTLAATRVYLGGENSELSFEKFPYTAASKTYCVDKQVADSACTATAYLTGVKANYATLGVTAAVPRGDCAKMNDKANHVSSIATWAQAKGKSTGIVTTSIVTDASPSGAYAHTAERKWQADSNIPEACRNTTIDIATQLVKGDVGKNFNVILGGGLKKFTPKSKNGIRTDNIDLTEEWIKDKTSKKARFINNKDALTSLADDTEFVFGLFSSGKIPYNLERNTSKIPSLEDMTKAAIKVASLNKNGYFLFIEGGRIDHGHHSTRAKIAIDETSEFSKAIQKAVEITNEQDTLIVVTSDHAHTMSLSGYPNRGNDIFGIGGKDYDKIPYRTLSYANGKGFRYEKDGQRYDASQDTVSKDYLFPAGVPLRSETHGGDDVLIFARGPWSHLFTGVVEQNVIPHYMAYAACVGEGPVACDNYRAIKSEEILKTYSNKSDDVVVVNLKPNANVSEVVLPG